MVLLAAGEQARGDRHIGYLGLDAPSIEKDVTGVENWLAKTAVAFDGRVVGWLLCETDDEMGRGWWWGPFVVATDWAGTADSLYETAAALVDVSEEEQAPDARNELAAAFALRQGFQSVIIRFSASSFSEWINSFLRASSSTRSSPRAVVPFIGRDVILP